MSRNPAQQPVQVPGAPAPDTAPQGAATTVEAAKDAAAAEDAARRRQAREVQGDGAGAVDPRDAELAALRAQLEAANARIAEQDAAASRPQVVYEPETPHGKANLEASAVSGLTVEQVRAAIQEKRLEPPITSYLCSDGYYARNDKDIPK